MTEKNNPDVFKGWLWKWTNYINRYQRRLFVLSNGFLFCYQSQVEMAHTCRGTINVASANIETEGSCIFTISNGETQTFCLKADSEVERQYWVKALENAKNKSSQMIGTEDDFSDDKTNIIVVEDSPVGDSLCNSIKMERYDLYSNLKTLTNKVDDLVTYNDLITKHGGALQRALTEIEKTDKVSNSSDPITFISKIKMVSERAALFEITMIAMIKACCSEFLHHAQIQGKRWHKPTIHDRKQQIYIGWLLKWTNYIKGYQRRLFVLSNEFLFCYRSPAEMANACKGTMNVASANIATEDSCIFTVSNGATQTFRLKAGTEVERQRWVTALELAKNNVSQTFYAEEYDEETDIVVEVSPVGDSLSNSVEMEHHNFYSILKTLTNKLDDLVTCNDLITKHGGELERVMFEFEKTDKVSHSSDPITFTSKIKTINERATLFKITATAVIKACSEFLHHAQTQEKRWHKAIINEREQQIRLRETVETLAKQHNALECAIRKITGTPNFVPKQSEEKHKNFQDTSDEDDEFVFTSDNTNFGKVVEVRNTNSRFVSAGSSTSLRDEPPESLKDSFGSVQKKKSIKRIYRTKIPDKPNYSLNLWSIIKNSIGQDLSKIPMPVNFNEPLSFLQRIGEDLEYSFLLGTAAKCESSQEQMAYIVAFSVSTYANTLYRTGKPFNPLLGETYECDRRDDLGFRMICEQVSHHPPIAAIHVDSADVGPNSGWTYWSEISLESKFRGKYLDVNLLGQVNVKFHATGNHYTWHKVTTTVHKIIVGKLWVDQSGDAEIVNHKTGDYCKHKYFPYSYFSRDTSQKVSGVIMDKNDKAHYVMSGTWDSHMDCAKIVSVNDTNRSKPLHKTLQPKQLWHKNSLPINAEKMYFFSTFALTLNDDEPDIAPTDSRLRPDQKLMENGEWDKANETKLRLEDAQRKRCTQREAEIAAKKASGETVEAYKPQWFVQKKCETTNELAHVYDGKYWKCKEKKDWSKCMVIFDLSSTSPKQSVS